MKLVVIIPAFNEEATIQEVIKKIPAIQGVKTEIVVIDDGSTDKTAQLAKGAGANVVSFARNRGLVAAFRKGVETALQLNADIIINIDGDGQHNQKDIPKIIEPIMKGDSEIVIGSRFKGNIESMSFVKYFGNKLFSWLISIIAKQKLTDTQSGFRAFTKEVAENIDIKRGKSYTQQMVIQAAYHKFKIIEIPISVKSRKGKSRLINNPFSFASKMFNLLLMVIAIYYPMKFFGFLGILFIIFGVLLGLIIVTANVLSSLIILTGIQLLFFGVLFEILNAQQKR